MATATSATNTNALRLYVMAHEKAVAKIGKAIFEFQPAVIKHALVAVEVANIVNGQDDDFDSQKVRQLLWDMTVFNAEQYDGKF